MSENTVKHWPIGGSTARRTLNCTGWPLAAKLGAAKAKAAGQPPRDDSSDAAKKGTYLHAVFAYFAERPELADVKGVLRNEAICQLPTGFAEAKALFGAASFAELDRIVYDKVNQAIEATRVMYWHQPEPPKLFHVEQPIQAPGKYGDIIGGTPDLAAVYTDGDKVVLSVADYKSGDGELQEVHQGGEANAVETQVGFYAVLMLANPPEEMADLNITHVELVVLHAWRDTFVPSKVMLTIEEFWETWEPQLDVVMHAADAYAENEDSLQVSLRAGSWCKYCPNVKTCPEVYAQAHKALKLDPNEATDLARLLDVAPALEELLKEAQKLATEALRGGSKIPGYKLVVNSRRTGWVDAPKTSAFDVADFPEYADVYLALRDKGNHDIFKPAAAPVMQTPKQISKLLGLTDEEFSSEYGELTITNVSHKVVPESDRRKSVLATDAMRDAIKQLENRN
jgi:hypothetical protein